MKKIFFVSFLFLVGAGGVASFIWSRRNANPTTSNKSALADAGMSAKATTTGLLTQVDRGDNMPEQLPNHLRSGGAAQSSGLQKEKVTSYYTTLLNRPELREMVARRLAKDYAPLFAQLKLTGQKEELLSQILVDQFTSLPGRMVRENYDKLAEELLAPAEYAEFVRFRDELLMQRTVDATMALLNNASGVASPGRSGAVNLIARAAMRIGDDPAWRAIDLRAEAGQPVSESDLGALAALASRRFESALVQHGATLTEAEKQALRVWYQKKFIEVGVFGLRQDPKPGGG